MSKPINGPGDLEQGVIYELPKDITIGGTTYEQGTRYRRVQHAGTPPLIQLVRIDGVLVRLNHHGAVSRALVPLAEIDRRTMSLP